MGLKVEGSSPSIYLILFKQKIKYNTYVLYSLYKITLMLFRNIHINYPAFRTIILAFRTNSVLSSNYSLLKLPNTNTKLRKYLNPVKISNTKFNTRLMKSLIIKSINLNLNPVSGTNFYVHPFFNSYFLSSGNSNLHITNIKSFISIYTAAFSLIYSLFNYNIKIFFFTNPSLHHEYNILN